MKKELRRMLCGIWFVPGICFTLVLCFFSELVMGETGSTILQILKNMSRSEMAQEPQLMPAIALRNAFSGYVTLFVPIIAALPMTQLLQIEARSGYQRFYMSRKPRREYYWNKWFAGMLSGALMLVLAAALFQGFMACSLPPVAGEVSAMYTGGSENQVPAILKIYIGIFAYGAFSVIPAIFISSFTDNFYFVICLPFLLCYFWDILISTAAKWLRNHAVGEGFSNLVEGFFSRAYLSILESGHNMLLCGIRIAALYLMILLLYRFYLNRRIDCGE